MKLNQPIQLGDFAALFNTEFIGNPEQEITGINEIHCVEKGDLTFVDHSKYYQKVLQSAASFIILNTKEYPCPEGKALIFSEDPFEIYNRAVKHFSTFSLSTQLVSSSAKIGKNTIIQPGAFVGNDVVIGNNCMIHANVTIQNHVIIGDHVIIHPGTVLGSDAFYFKKRPGFYEKMVSCGRVIIGDDVEIGAACTIDRGVSGDTVIGQGTKLDNQIHVGHDTRIGRNCLIAAQTGIAGVTVIEDDVILWGQVGVNKDLVIGRGAVVLAQSGVGKSIEPGKVYFGSPAAEVKERFRELASLKQLPNLLKELRK
jgi:UDP-3-O-[3-hydroxymyristoyl] glucosamine N-acyltransferase